MANVRHWVAALAFAAMMGAGAGGGVHAADVLASGVKAKFPGLFSATAGLVPASPDLGFGVDSLTGRTRGKCLAAFEEAPLSVVAPGQDVQYSINLVESVEGLASSLNADLSAGLSSGFGTASGKIGWIKERRVNSYSLFLVVSVIVRNQELKIKPVGSADGGSPSAPPRLDVTADWRQRLKLGDAEWQAFEVACGDSFVIGSIKGGEFHSVFEMRTRSEQERETLRTHIRGSGLTGTWTAEASFNQSMERIARLTEMQAAVFIRSAAGLNKIPDKPEEIRDFAVGFPKRLADKGYYTYEWTITDYQTLALPAANPYSAQAQKRILQDLAEQEGLGLTYLSNIAYAQANPSEFDLDPAQRKRLIDIDEEIRGILNDIYVKSAACYAREKECAFRSRGDLLQLHADMPQRKAPAPTVGACRTESQEFLTFAGGCKDLSTGYVWSLPAPGPRTAADAVAYCAKLRESGVGGWVLPNATELATLTPQGRGATHLPGDIGSWFWSADRKRVSIRLGTVAEMDPGFTLGVLCRRSGTGPG